MKTEEPVLREEDQKAWEMLRKRSLVHAQLDEHRRRIKEARDLVNKWAVGRSENPCVMWSAGKDSTALTHLVQQEIPRVSVYSQKDDLDFPGERDYLRRVSDDWDIDLEIIEPDFSVFDAVMSEEVGAHTDIHSRASELSQRAFYELVESASSQHDLTILGIRADESRGRAMNVRTRGEFYKKKDGERVLNPIAGWTDDDVYAYLFSREIEILHVYRCIGFMHADNPGRVRKSWWLPAGKGSEYGRVKWVRHYWPSLWQKIRDVADFDLLA